MPKSIKHLLAEPGSDVMNIDGNDVYVTTRRIGNTMRVALAVDRRHTGQWRSEAMLRAAEQALCDALESSDSIAFHVEEPLDPLTRAVHHKMIDGWLVAFYTVRVA